MTETRVFQRPETVPLHISTRSMAGSYLTPISVKITVTDPDGGIVVNDQVMALDTEYTPSTGHYVYYYRPAVDAVLGWYKVSVTIVDGVGPTAKTIVVLGGFILQ